MNIMAKVIAGFVAGLILMCLLAGSIGMFVVNLGVITTGQALQIETNQSALGKIKDCGQANQDCKAVPSNDSGPTDNFDSK